MNLPRRTLLKSMAALSAMPLATHAQAAWPERPVKLVVPFPPGGATDVDARLFAAALGPALGGTLVIENLPGAGGTNGTTQVARAKPDGYTLEVGNIATHAVATGLYDKLQYAAKDFEPIAHTGKLVNVLVVHQSLGIKSVKDLIAYAKSKPGKLTYGSAGAGGTPHLSAELFKLRTQTDILHVPYKGGGPMLIDLMGGQIDLAFANIPDLSPHLKDPRLVPLAVTSRSRWPGVDLPSIEEAGVPDYDVTSWIGLFAPAGIPAAVKQKLVAASAEALKSASLKSSLNQANTVIEPLVGEDFKKYVQSQSAFWSDFLKKTGIRLDL
jgi:tripartite-type tricarboxylate transporter receptor subunit TctC